MSSYSSAVSEIDKQIKEKSFTILREIDIEEESESREEERDTVRTEAFSLLVLAGGITVGTRLTFSLMFPATIASDEESLNTRA